MSRGATLRFWREAGWGNAMRSVLTGDEFDAIEALRIGLVQETTADGAPAVARAVTLAAGDSRELRATGRGCHPDIGPPQS
jgi:enoyl-CoA hydratase/carnithine racemase